MQARTRINRTLVTGFMIMLYLPLAYMLLIGDSGRATSEKRMLAGRPAWPVNADELAGFPQRFEAYFNDRFGFRNLLVYAHNLLKTKFGISAAEDVLIGKDGWLFYADKQARVIEGYRNIDPLSPHQLQTWKHDLEQKYDWLQQQGIEYLFVVAPNKHTIYPEFIPEWIRKENRASRWDQLLATVSDSKVPLLDLRQALIDAKQTRVYHKTDTHWNLQGANTVQYEILRVVASSLPKLAPKKHNKFNWYQGDGGDLALLLGLAEELQETRPIPEWPQCYNQRTPEQWLEKEMSVQCTGGQYSMLMFHDSFGNPLRFFLAGYFANSHYNRQRADFALLKKEVAKYRPDVVIEELAERSLLTVPTVDPAKSVMR